GASSAPGISPAWLVVEQRNFCQDSGPSARCGGDVEPAADHLQTLSHAEQPQAFVLFGVQSAFGVEADAVVFYFHGNGAIHFLDPDSDLAGLGVAGDVVEGLLGDAIEDGSFIAIHPVHTGKGGQAYVDAGLLLEGFHKTMKSGDEAEVVEDGGAQFAGEAMDDAHRVLHQVLGAGDAVFDAPG